MCVVCVCVCVVCVVCACVQECHFLEYVIQLSTEMHKIVQMDRETGGQPTYYRQRDKYADRYIDRQTGRQTGR